MGKSGSIGLEPEQSPWDWAFHSPGDGRWAGCFQVGSRVSNSSFFCLGRWGIKAGQFLCNESARVVSLPDRQLLRNVCSLRSGGPCPTLLPVLPRFYLSCTGFPECRSAVWFPDSVLEASRDDSVCPVCQPHPVYR